MTLLENHFLGAFDVQLNAKAVSAFPTDKIRALLVYLALEPGQPHRRETLATLLWPEMEQSAALANLRLALHRLRETFERVQAGVGETLLHSTRQTLQLDPLVTMVDVNQFQKLLTACTTHVHTELVRCAECHTRLMQAVALYGGELLAGFGLPDAPAFEEWLLLRREHLHQQAMVALHTLVQSCEQQGDDLQAHHYARRQLELDPSREEAHRQLMRSLARRGLRNEALSQYESCRRILHQELGVAPDPETVALYEQIRSGQIDKTPPAQSQPAAPPALPLVTNSPVSSPPAAPQIANIPPRQDWRDAPEIGKLYGRQSELARLEQWLVHARCRVVAILGIGGLGKTTLAAAAVNTIAAHFASVIWRSLLNAPPLAELLRDILQRLSDAALTDIPTTLDAQLALLLGYLRQRPCLLVLDNLESILQPDQPGQMRPGYAGYAQLIQIIAERNHQSSLLLTSRERPQGLARWAEDSPLVRTLPLEGLSDSAAQAMLSARGLGGTMRDSARLIARYSGHPLALKLVAQTVQELFGGDVASFLAVDAPIFDDIRRVLDQQFVRLLPLEQELLLWLAVERVPVTAVTLRANLVAPPPMPRFLEALRALQRRSLLEGVGNGFTLQNVLIEYLTERLVERVCEEIADGWATDSSSQPVGALWLNNLWLNRHALLKTQAAEHIRQSQSRLILQAVGERLLERLGKSGLAAQIEGMLTTLRRAAPLAPGYAAGNLLNLLLGLEMDVSGYDFSRLSVWQAHLRGAYLPRLQLAGADLRGAAFTHRVGGVHGFQFRGDGELLIMSFSEGSMGLWRAHTGELLQRLKIVPHTFHPSALSRDCRCIAQLASNHQIALVDVAGDRVLHTLTGSTSPIWQITFSPNGQYVASGHVGGQVCVWEVASGRCCAEWQAHAKSITALAWAADNLRIATGALDNSAMIWHAHTGTRIHTLRGHSDEVSTLDFTPDGERLITGSHDLTVRLWSTSTGELLAVLQGHSQLVRHLAIAPNGRWLASGGVDRFLYLWDLASGKAQHILADQDASVDQITFSPDSQTVAVYHGNETISFWAVPSGQRVDAYRLHYAAIHALAFSPDGRFLVAGGGDSAVYLWDVSQPTQPFVTARLAGHRSRVLSVAFSSDGATLAIGDMGGLLRLWQRRDETHRIWASRTLLQTQGELRSVAFSPDGQTLASASSDGLRLWSVATGRQTHLLPGPTQAVRTCAFSNDGRWFASSHVDHTICLWEVDRSGDIALRHRLHQHSNFVQALLFSPDSRTLFSCSFDNTLCRWDVFTGTLHARWATHGTFYVALAIQPDGQRIASGGGDHPIRLLDSESGELYSLWHGHTHTIEALSFRPDGQLLASASWDETIRLWDVSSGTCLQTLRTPGPYSGMNISGVTGISEAQKAALKALGALEQ